MSENNITQLITLVFIFKKKLAQEININHNTTFKQAQNNIPNINNTETQTNK